MKMRVTAQFILERKTVVNHHFQEKPQPKFRKGSNLRQSRPDGGGIGVPFDSRLRIPRSPGAVLHDYTVGNFIFCKKRIAYNDPHHRRVKRPGAGGGYAVPF